MAGAAWLERPGFSSRALLEWIATDFWLRTWGSELRPRNPRSDDPVLAERFALESDTELARGDGSAARKQRKLVLLDDVRLRRWDGCKNAVMRDAMCAKFSRHETLRAVLLATGPAQLWRGTGRGQPPARVHDLETIRAELRP